jgi:hypothetical protein
VHDRSPDKQRAWSAHPIGQRRAGRRNATPIGPKRALHSNQTRSYHNSSFPFGESGLLLIAERGPEARTAPSVTSTTGGGTQAVEWSNGRGRRRAMASISRGPCSRPGLANTLVTVHVSEETISLKRDAARLCPVSRIILPGARRICRSRSPTRLGTEALGMEYHHLRVHPPHDGVRLSSARPENATSIPDNFVGTERGGMSVEYMGFAARKEARRWNLEVPAHPQSSEIGPMHRAIVCGRTHERA